MKNFLLTLLFIFSLNAKSQLYVSGSVLANANGCSYSLDGNFYQSGNATPLVFVYDSANVSYKFLSLIAADSVTICLSSTDCNCLPECISSPVGLNMIFNIEICNTTNLEKNKKDIEIYPNPFSDFINIEKKDDYSLTIYNSQMSIMISETNRPLPSIETISWSKGIYFIVIENSKGRKIYKFVK
jgi:hypothetical protein